MALKNIKEYAATLKPGDAVLFVLASIHTLAALSLLILFALITPAKAEDLSCGGHNILESIKAKDPKGYSELVDETAKLENAQSIFWKVEKAGSAPSWLLGTMHLSDPRVIDMPDKAQAAYDASKTVIVESDEIADKKKAQAAIMMRPDLTMFSDGKTIYDYIDADQKKLLEAQLQERGMPLAAVATMKPWMISSFVALPTCELKRKMAGAEFLDEKLTKEAIAEGKTLKGLETVTEQLEAMSSVSMQTHIAGLIGVLKDPQRTKDLMETMIELYDKGNPAMIGPLSTYISKQDEDGADLAEFEQKMITIRNQNMVDRAEDALAEGSAFMAVGALHLPGEDGIVSLLREKGFTVTPVE